MKIQNKLFLFLIGFSLILVTVLVMLMQWSIGKGMVQYVLSKEIETLKPVITQLTETYKEKKNWRFIEGNHNKFRRLLSKALDNSEFAIPNRMGPPPRDALKDKPRLPPHLRESKLPPHEVALQLAARDRDNKKHKPKNRYSAQTRNPPPMHGPNNGPSAGPSSRPPSPKAEAQYALLDNHEKLVVGLYDQTLDYVKVPITIGNNTVGYFAISKRNQLTQGYEVDFLEQQQHYFWLISILVMCLVALVTFPIARHVVQPIKKIAKGMHKLTQGDYEQSIKLNRKDELEDLSRDYNELALTLSENETTRKRWLADISHELRTPVAILRGELEAMLDGVRPLTTHNILSANDEVKQLQRLIDDLNILTSTDIGGMSYRKQNEDLIDLLQSDEQKYTDYLAKAGIRLNYEIKLKEAIVYIDINRLTQLFENIINNSIKYSKASQFKISLLVHESNENINLIFEDDGIGVDDSHLPHLFEHLYRVEDSRNRKTGGSGLGLSICRHIVKAHQGKIHAQKSSLGGLAVTVSLPLLSKH